MKYILLLDFDGTLTPIVKTPGKAQLSSPRRKFLKSLLANKNLTLAIVSGRQLITLRRKVNLGGVYYIGNHGLEISGPRIKFIHLQARKIRPLLTQIKDKLKQQIKIRGILVEDKNLTLALHYRLASRAGGLSAQKTARKILTPYLKAKKIKITRGKKVLEVQPPVSWNKGHAVCYLINQLKYKSALPIYIGDDQTDEDAFKILRRRGMTIKVGRNRSTLARYNLKDVRSVYNFLHLFQSVLKSGIL